MYEAKLEQRRVIVFILSLALISLALSWGKKNLAERADSFIYLSNPQENSSAEVAKETPACTRAAEIMNINIAEESQLQTIPGIGRVIASRIVEYRLQHGPFTSKEDLVKIKGIGRKKLTLIEKYIRVE